MDKKSIFICYSHEDQKWLKKVEPFLKVLESDADIDWWADTRIEPGTKWDEEIKQALNHATAALLLVSTPFLNSTFIKDEEIPILLQRSQTQGVFLLLILVRKCNWELVPWLNFTEYNKINKKSFESMKRSENKKFFKERNQKILTILNGEPRG